MAKQLYQTNFYVASHWLHNALILANEIGSIDPSVYDNMRFSFYEEDEYGDETEVEIYQWFLTDCSDFDVRFLEEHFGLKFTYSDLLGLYILCVTHYGTSWDYVYWETDIPQAARELGDKK